MFWSMFALFCWHTSITIAVKGTSGMCPRRSSCRRRGRWWTSCHDGEMHGTHRVRAVTCRAAVDRAALSPQMSRLVVGRIVASRLAAPANESVSAGTSATPYASLRRMSRAALLCVMRQCRRASFYWQTLIGLPRFVFYVSTEVKLANFVFRNLLKTQLEDSYFRNIGAFGSRSRLGFWTSEGNFLRYGMGYQSRSCLMTN